ncbi:MAG: F0F1 ATP synthase subunit A [Candidatus Omnitrophota bacterium]
MILALFLPVARTFKRPPSKPLALFDLLYGSFADMADDAMGPDGRKFVPLVITIFLFVLFSNWISIIPGFKSPTEDLNTCLGLGILVFIISHASSIAKKGLGKYLKGYTEPFILFLPMNIMGEIGKLVSHSFRLFGNIFAGAVIFALIGPVIIKTANAMGFPTYSAYPSILVTFFVAQAFFGLFVGFVQALVFSLLALTYISILREA